MKICFIYSQNNSGQCGITDYVGLIAQELEKLGHQIDRFFINNGSGRMTDLPNSDLYSIQFAPYAYANNGIPKHTLKSLARKLQNQKIHLNFHEIWVGAYPRASWKEKSIGWLQKNLILRFINKCKPAYITSSNAAAIDRLRHTGIPVKFLYLFGNIPYSCESGATPKCDSLKVAFLGTPYADFNYGELEDFFSTLSKISGKIPEIIVIGRQRDKTGAQKIVFPLRKGRILM